MTIIIVNLVTYVCTHFYGCESITRLAKNTTTIYTCIQWNPFTVDTVGTQVTVLISGVVLYRIATKESVYISGVSTFRGSIVFHQDN